MIQSSLELAGNEESIHIAKDIKSALHIDS